jgi:serine/threonine protein kinase
MQRKGGEPGETRATRIEKARIPAMPMDERSSDPLVGAVMTGKRGAYTILAPLDAGGMGKVYTAADGKGDTVVVKVISPNFVMKSSGDSEKIVDRFFREARAAAAVDHENVIRIFDVGSYKQTVFCAMEYLKGVNLKDMTENSRPSWQLLAPIMMDVCDGVDAAHRRGIIHRDLSPDNIFLAEIGGRKVVKVLDFGLAKFTQGEDDGLTKTGFAMGKITYMAPEQAEKALGNRLDYDHRVDVYAMGVIMYKLLTGVAPFKGETDAQTLFMRLNVTPMRPCEINPGITPEAEEVIMKAMARREEDRYQSAAELKAAIASARPGAAAAAKPGSDDMFLGDILASMEHSGPSAPKPVQPLVRLPDEATNSGESYTPGARKKKSVLGRVAGWAVVLALAGGAAFAIHHYQRELMHYIGDVRTRATNSRAPSASPPANSAAPSGTAVMDGYLASMDSTPTGASVYEVVAGRREYLGMTPISRRFPDGEHSLVFTKRGYASKRATVSQAQPVAHVNLGRAGRPQTSTQPAIPEQGESTPAGGADNEEAPVE